MLYDKNGWISDSLKGPLKIYYRYIQGTPLVAIRSEIKVDINIVHLISLIYEIELYNYWFPFCK